MISGLILAGGKSERAKTNKLLLEVDHKPLILHTIETLKTEVDELVVVTGKYDQELRAFLMNEKVVYNQDFELGMFSSVKAGLKEIDNDVLILPGDMMNVSKETIRKITNTKGKIVVPTYLGKHGHPLFLNKEMVDLVKKEDIKSNLKAFINKHLEDVKYVEVNDKYICFDIDTIKDYKRFLNERKEYSYES